MSKINSFTIIDRKKVTSLKNLVQRHAGEDDKIIKENLLSFYRCFGTLCYCPLKSLRYSNLCPGRITASL